MARVPEPEQTPDGPAYEGRLLDRPTEEVVDQGAPFDLRTLFSRRGVLGLVGAGVRTMALAACGATSSSGSATGSSASSVPEIPDETAGPYPADGSNCPDILEQSGIVRSDIRSSIDGSEPVEGVPLTFTLKVSDMANDNTPFESVAVYAWHCDAQGRYSMYSDGVEDATWLRGVQVADENGEVTFTSVFPACYTGRWPHIHFEVYPDVDSATDAQNAISTSQMALSEDACKTVFALEAYDGSAANMSQVSLDDDNVFGDDGGEHQLATISGDADSGYVASLDVPVDTETEPTGGQAPDGGGGAPGGGGCEPPEGGGPEGGVPPEQGDTESSEQ